MKTFVITSSDEFITVSPSIRQNLEAHKVVDLKKPYIDAFYTAGFQRRASYTLTNENAKLLTDVLGENSKNFVLAVNLVYFTCEEVCDLIDRGQKVIENTENYFIYSMQKMFNHQTHIEVISSKGKKIKRHMNVSEPGTIRIYSKDLVCVSDGFDWYKVR